MRFVLVSRKKWGFICVGNWHLHALTLCWRVQVFHTGTVRGWGVRALVEIPAKEVVMEYSGELLREEEAAYRELNYSNAYMLNIGKG